MSAPGQSGRYVASLRLDAVYAAVGLARGFIRRTLAAWQLPEQIDGAELVGSELVTNAVKMSGQAGGRVVGLQLRVLGAGLYVEVWDRESGVPVIPAQSPDAEGGRGLFLVEALSTRWDVYRPAAGGKVVWSELPLGKEAEEWVLAESALGERIRA